MSGWRRRQLLAAGLSLTATLLPRTAFGSPLKTASARVVIVGGGFAGATAARYLRRWAPDLHVTLVVGTDRYWTCPFSNLVLVGERPLDSLEVHRSRLAKGGIELLRATATGFDPEQRTLELADGSELRWDRLVLAPGIEVLPEAIEGHDAAGVERFPHAWQGGPATADLARRLRDVPDGGLVVITVPEAPYRCPPGPYERASLFAWWLARHRPQARLVILDANDRFTKDELFKDHWRQVHGDRLQWFGQADGGTLRAVEVRRGTLHTDFDDWRPDLACVIPPQRAAAVARQAGLDEGRGWCAVDPRTFASRIHPDIHVIGDAAIANPMPKSAFAAASQARVCAAAIATEFAGQDAPEAILGNTCYSLLEPDLAISVSGSYRGTAAGIEALPGSTGTSPLDATAEVRRAEAGHARGWYAAARADAFGD